MNVTIVGGGFGGVKTAQELSMYKDMHITLISDGPNFQYYPALYSTATGHTSKKSWVPLKQLFGRNPRVTLINDRISAIEPSKKTLSGEDGTIYSYENVVLALGSVTTYFGIEGLDTYSYGIKSQEEIRRLQEHLFEEMSDGSDDETHYVIIGAGPTGVELAGALGEYVLELRRHFGIRRRSIKINLIEAAPRVLPRLSEASSVTALKRLQKLGVKVETNKKVEKQTADSLIVNGRPLKTQTVIWTSGVANAPFYKENANHFTINERGKVVVNEYMQTHPNVYVIGDNAATPYAGLAQTALHDALFVSRHLHGRRKPYKAVLPPNVVPIGDNWALFEWRMLRFSGRMGGVLRSLADLVGYSDVFPLGWAIGTWRSSTQKELRIPDEIGTAEITPLPTD